MDYLEMIANEGSFRELGSFWLYAYVKPGL